MKTKISVEVIVDDAGAFKAIEVDGKVFELSETKPAPRTLGQALASAAAKRAERELADMRER